MVRLIISSCCQRWLCCSCGSFSSGRRRSSSASELAILILTTFVADAILDRALAAGVRKEELEKLQALSEPQPVPGSGEEQLSPPNKYS